MNPRLLIAVQVAALVVLGAVTVARFHVLAEIDERAHYDYVQAVAEDRRIPRPTDLVSPEVLAVEDGSWPGRSERDPRSLGLGGRSYEAFQPPLYYVAAAPAFAAVGDHRDKVFAVRAFDFALVLAAVALLWVLARRIGGGAAAATGFACVLAVALWPGVVVRGTTIGNTPLELLVTAAFLLALWAADRRPARRAPALAAAVLLGLALLTKLSLVALVPVFLAVLWRRRRRAEGLALAAVPVLVLAPWLAMNVSRYDALTVDLAGGGGVVGGVQGGGAWSRLADLPERNASLVDGILAQEFRFQLDVWWVKGLLIVLAAGLLALTIVSLVRHRRDWRLWFLALPALGGLAVMNGVYVLTASDQFLLRYLYPGLLPLALGIGLCLSRTAALRVAAGATAAACALWVDMAGAFYFTDVGAALGI